MTDNDVNNLENIDIKQELNTDMSIDENLDFIETLKEDIKYEVEGVYETENIDTEFVNANGVDDNEDVIDIIKVEVKEEMEDDKLNVEKVFVSDIKGWIKCISSAVFLKGY